MKIAFVNDIHIGPNLEFQGKVRAFSRMAENALPFVLKYIVERHQVDLIVNLGDLIRTEEKELDLRRYESALRIFKQAGCPVLHMIGNHELKRLSLGEIETLWHQYGFVQNSYGVKYLGGVRLIWLGLEVESQMKKYRLPEEQLRWLEKELDNPDPTLILTHCALDDQDINGNFFYETFNAKDPTGFFLQNREEVNRLIRKHPAIIGVVQAHLHQFKIKQINHTPYITIPAMGDHIASPHGGETIPEIYSILSFDEGKFLLQAYSREFCFAGFEYSVQR